MKNVLKALCMILLMAPSAVAQQVNADAFKRDLQIIMQDAEAGFPKTMGTFGSEYYGFRTYSSNVCLLGEWGQAGLHYNKAFESTRYSGPLDEAFYFAQTFTDSTSAGKFVVANGEDILDGIAKEAGWKKKKLKMDRFDKDRYKDLQYSANGKPKLGIRRYLKTGDMDVRVYAPYRPRDVKVANLLGCMVYSFANMGFMYVVPVYGSSLGDKEKVAAAAYTKSGLVESRYQYEWMPGATARQVEQKWGQQTAVRIMSAYNVD